MPAPSRLLAAALVLVGIGLVVGWSWSEVDAPPRVADGAVRSGADRAAFPTHGEERERVLAPAGTGDVAVGARLVFGRCVQAPGLVLPDVAVAVFAGEAPNQSPHETVKSGADGRFSLSVDGALVALRFELRHEGHAPVVLERDDLPSSGLLDLGDVWLPATGLLHGEVVESSGAPVPRAIVRLLHTASTGTSFSWAAPREGLCDEAGRFQFAEPLAVGEWYPMLVGTGGLLAPRRVLVEAGDTPRFLRIEVEAIDVARSIIGRVVDAEDAGVAGIDVTGYGDGHRGEARTGADGAFVLPCAGPSFDRGGSGVVLDVRSDAYERSTTSPQERVQWGQRDVVLAVQEFGRTRVRLVPPPDRQAPSGTWRVHRVLPEGALIELVRGAARAEPGPILQLQSLRAGAHVVWFVPDDATLPIAGPLRFAAAGPSTAAEHELPWPSPGELEVVVQDAAGRPFAASSLELVQAVGKPADAAKVALPLRPPGQRVGRAMQVLVATATTDERGVARLAPAPGEYLLRIAGRRHRPTHRLVAVAAGAQRLVVVADLASVVFGSLAPQRLVDAAWASGEAGGQPPTVLAYDEQQVELGRGTLGRDGTFELASLPPGTVSLRAWLWASFAGDEPQRVEYGLGNVLVPTANEWRGVFDLTDQQPGAVTGTLWLDGSPLAGAHLFAYRHRPEPLWMARLSGDAAGRFAATLPAGEYSFALAVPHQPGPGHVIVPWPEHHQLAAGGSLDVRLEQFTRRKVVRVLRDRQPVVAARLRFEALGYQQPTSLQTDADGRCVVQMPPPLPFAWTLTTADGKARALPAPAEAAWRGDGEFEVLLGADAVAPDGR